MKPAPPLTTWKCRQCSHPFEAHSARYEDGAKRQPYDVHFKTHGLVVVRYCLRCNKCRNPTFDRVPYKPSMETTYRMGKCREGRGGGR